MGLATGRKIREHSQYCHGGRIIENGGIADNEFRVTTLFKKCLDSQNDEGLRISTFESMRCHLELKNCDTVAVTGPVHMHGHGYGNIIFQTACTKTRPDGIPCDWPYTRNAPITA